MLKKIMPLFLLTLGVIASETEFQIEPRLPRKIQIGKENRIPLVKSGKVGFEIIASRTPVAEFAAKEAAAFLGKAVGTQIEVLEKPSKADIPHLIFGDAAYAKKWGIKASELDRDGFVIQTHGKDVLIFGRDEPASEKKMTRISRIGLSPERGTLYGTYSFLERFAGIRFYFPGDAGTIVPHITEWSLPEIDIYDRPDCTQRIFHDTGIPAYMNRSGLAAFLPDGVSPELYWLHHVRLRLGTMCVPSGHGLAYLGYVQRFAKSHPEYFALKTDGSRFCDPNAPGVWYNKMGHLCFSSEIKKEIVEDAKAFLTGQPPSVRGVVTPDGKSCWHPIFARGIPVFDISPNDGLYPCQCPECRPYTTKGEEKLSEFMWNFFIDEAEALQKKGVRGYVGAPAYGKFRNPPDRKIPDNIFVRLAIPGPWSLANPQKYAEDMALFEKWQKKLGRKFKLSLAMINWDEGYTPFPHSTPEAAAAFFKQVRGKTLGSFIECESERWLYGYLNHYIIAKVLWNNAADTNAILDEHYQQMFGAGAAAMKEFYKTLERNWLTICGKPYFTETGTVFARASLQDVWNDIYSQAERERIERLFADARNAAKNDSASLKRIEYIRKNMWLPIPEAYEKYARLMNDKLYWKAVMPEDWKNAEKYYLIPSGKRNASEVKTFFTMRHDKDNFYFRIECEEPYTDELVMEKRKFDDPDIWRDSCVEILLNPENDRKSFYQILVNPAGCLSDLKHMAGKDDWSWNSGAEVKTWIVPVEKWVAEVRIPRASMNPVKNHSFPANIGRHRMLKKTKVMAPFLQWSFFAVRFRDVENFGTFLLKAETQTQLLSDGDFDKKAEKKRLGKWACVGPFKQDRYEFLTGGASLRLDPESCLVTQWLPELKPNTTYKISFYLKMDGVEKSAKPNTGFGIDLREGNGRAASLPRIKITGTFPWTRYEYTVTTGDKVGSVHKPYFRFVLYNVAKGTAWVDHAQITEVGSVKELK